MQFNTKANGIPDDSQLKAEPPEDVLTTQKSAVEETHISSRANQSEDNESNAASALVDGFIEGSRSNTEQAAPVAAAMAKAAAEEVEAVIGVVTDCSKLNLRCKPDPEAEILTTLPALSEVDVDLKNSTDTFFKVFTDAGIQGFCMKKYIAIRH